MPGITVLLYLLSLLILVWWLVTALKVSRSLAGDDRHLRKQHTLALGGGILLAMVVFAGDAPPVFEEGLDPSWQLVLESATKQRTAYGRDVVFTFGPLGPISQDVTSSLGVFQAERTAFLFWMASIYGALWWHLGRRLPVAIGGMLLVWQLTVPGGMLAYVVTALLSWRLKSSSPFSTLDRLMSLGIAPLCLGLLALVKFTYFVAALAILGAWLISGVLGKKIIHPLIQWFVFAVAVSGLWLLCGQHISDLPQWIATGFQVSSAYADAMGVIVVDHLTMLLAAAIVASAVIAILLLSSNAVLRRDIPLIFLTLVCLGQIAIHWKHSVIRADEHLILIHLLVPLMICIVLAESKNPETDTTRNSLYPWLAFGGAAIIAGISLAGQAGALRKPIPSHLASQLGAIKRSLSFPRFFSSQEALIRSQITQTTRTKLALPHLSSTLADQPVDVFNYQQSVVFANEMNYRHRPVIQSYQACTKGLSDINKRWWMANGQNLRLLCSVESIDGRLPCSDDPLLWPIWLTTLTPVAIEKNFTLLEPKTQSAVQEPTWRIAQEGIGEIGKPLTAPQVAGNSLLRLRVKVARSPWGKVVKAAFQPETIKVVTTMVDGTRHQARIIPPALDAGVLLVPYLETNVDLIAYHANSHPLLKRPAMVQLDAGHGRTNELKKEFQYAWEICDRLPAQDQSDQLTNQKLLAEMALYAPGTTPTPLQNCIPQPVLRISRKTLKEAEIEGKPAMRVDAPSIIVTSNRSNGGTLEGSFTIPERCWNNKKPTDGVRFIVAICDHDGKENRLLDRYLDPAKVESDRDVQYFRLTIPSGSPPLLMLRTEPGPSIDKDWATWGQLRWTGLSPN